MFKKLFAILATTLVIGSACAADFRVECSEGFSYNKGNCPAVITVTLDNEILLATTTFGDFFYCPEHGWANRACTISGTYTVLNGELTIKELGKAYLMLHTTKKLGYCYQFFGPYACSKLE